ncbi:cytochrome P450 2C20-like isoform X1 [Clavelina lepadiformis]|uniref:cytochrome P450 2C20-like isoform X1 n=1 Tax=Clavelina lepadiformis TaxID=159417 RepID=UPI004042AC1C
MHSRFCFIVCSWSLETMLTYVALVGLGLVVYGMWKWFYFKPKCFPPGLDGLPLLGCIPFWGDHRERTFTEWGKKFGDVFYVRIGMKRVLVLNSFKVIHEAFNGHSHDFSGRVKSKLTEKLKDGDNGLLSANDGRKLRCQRRFALRTLKDFGMGKQNMKHHIIDEAGFLCDAIEATAARKNFGGIDLNLLVGVMSCNVVSRLLFGKRFEDDNPILQQIVSDIRNRTLRQEKILFAMLFFDEVLRLPFLKGKIEKSVKRFQQRAFQIREIVHEHQTSRAMHDEPRDFVDSFIDVINKETSQKEKDNNGFTEDQLIQTAADVISAGTDTTAHTILWGILLLLKHPNVLQRFLNEISTVQLEMITDHKVAPFSHAVMQEVLRFRPAAPSGVPRCTTNAVKIMGYHIPKGVACIPNIWAVHHDPDYWSPDPGIFRPGRHLDENGCFVSSERVIPFSIGRRACIGSHLARMEFLLALACIFSRFRLCLDFCGHDKELRGGSGILLRPPHFTVRVYKRHN